MSYFCLFFLYFSFTILFYFSVACLKVQDFYPQIKEREKMLGADIEKLSQLLDKNAGFTRPEGQTTGFSSEQEHDGASASPANPLTAIPAVSLPSTIVDKQLNLPAPSMSKKTLRAKLQPDTLPKGNELWSQEELRCVHDRKVSVPVVEAPGEVATAVDRDGTHQREEPEYVVLEKQSITAEDVYLGVDFTRDVSSSDGVVVKVMMPKLEKSSDLNIKVEPFQLFVSSPNYFLNAALPCQCVTGKADAQWDGQKKTLEVHLVAEKSETVHNLL